MTEPNPNYDRYISEIENEKEKKQIRHTIYLSRRAIWANILLIILFSSYAGYIHTRCWKALAIFFSIVAGIGMLASINAKSFEESLDKSFEAGANFAPVAMIIAAVDNGLAIHRARKKIAAQSTSLDPK